MDCIALERPALTVKTFAIPDRSFGQLDLFADLLAGAVPSVGARAKFVRRRRPKRKPQFQAAIEFRDPDDIPEDGDFPAHRVVAAAECKPPATRAFRSVWDLGTVDDRAPRPSLRMGSSHAEQTRAILRRIVREAETTVHVAIREQETEEWRDKEERRRARQRPPQAA